MNDHEGFGRVRGLLRRHWALGLVLIAVPALATSLHHDGHSWGDDFTLYLRQAKGLVDGNVGQVIADNHFNVDNAARPGFSPYVYPWGFPMLLAPFLRLWGLDYSKLKLIEVACFCGFLGFFHAVLRRRMAQWLALGTVAAVGTTLAYLRHTDHLLSEMPYMFAAAATLWWLDRCRRDHPLDAATRNELVALGLLAMLVFNTRREGLAIIGAIAAAQLVDLRGRRRAADLRRAATPYVSFVVGVVLLQLMLPSALAPSYVDAGLHQTWKKLQGPFRRAFADQLGLRGLGGWGLLAVFLLVLAGIAIRLWRRPGDDAPLFVFAVGSMTIAGMIPANGDRYLLGVTPFALYFALQVVAAIPRPPRVGTTLALTATALLTVVHVWGLPREIRAVRDFESAGYIIDGPEAPSAQAAFAAVRLHTHQDDVVAFFKARALTFYTNRRAVQSSDLEIVRQRADYFMMRRNSTSSQPLVSTAQAASFGWQEVWSDPSWVLWRLTGPAG